MLLQNAATGRNSLGHWRSKYWAAELGIYYSNVYGKISFAPLNILASVSDVEKPYFWFSDLAALTAKSEITKFFNAREGSDIRLPG